MVIPSLSPSRIQLLDPNTINQIAAGEVVERPAAVVKELVENSLDAGATRIEIELVGAGRDLIRVSDNGCGMTSEEARMCLLRHATSKIRGLDDLIEVRSLGFRGEAIPSIGSVSRMTISTAIEDGMRTVVRVEGGDVLPDTAVAGPQGTEIRVEDLFYNTPARLKFLKSDTTEVGQAVDFVMKYAIANPGVAFYLTHNGQKVIQTSGSGEQLEAISDVWGRDTARSLVPVDAVLGGIRIQGFVSPPHITKPTRNLQYLYVNGRPMKSRTLTVALDQAFRDLTPERRFPLVALNIEIEPLRIDVNVSPTKSEVKFQHEGAAFEGLRVCIREALLAHGMMPSAAQIALANQALRQVQAPPFASSSELSFFAQSPLGGQAAVTAPELAQPKIDFDQFVPSNLAANPALAQEAMPYIQLLDDLRIIGQAMKTFIIAETRHGLVIVDQHVAHERILYEYLCGLKRSSLIEKQNLLMPQTLHLDRRAALLLEEKLDEIRSVGFDLESFGGDAYVVRAVPAALRSKDPIKHLKDLIDEMVESSVTRKLVPTREQIWIMSSCKMAVKSGDVLSHAEMEKLMIDLATTENPYHCPHGRPITATLTHDDLLRLFKRI
ncbi:MAG: DNA mismatch repair endonuclease MutL [Armatimonadetes bacterium]|nr:DNA mismatch repair endonuclease MutL [Armatimonadota bacterium]